MATDPVLHLFPELQNVDLTSLNVKLSVIFLTCAFFLLVFLLSYVGSYLFVTSFTTRLTSKQKVFWCLTFVRAVFGFSATLVGAYYLFVDGFLLNDVVNANNTTTFMTVYYTVGFFTFECVALLASNVYYGYFDSFLFLHHVLSLVGYSLCSAYDGKGHFFALVGLLLEVTTPFSCFCWMLLKCDMAQLHIWKLNQLILVHLFHCRTTLEGFFYYMYIKEFDSIRKDLPLTISAIILTQLTLNFFVLTPYWTYKKMMQLFNPMDWNHPETSKTSVTNGTVPNGRQRRRGKKRD